MPSLTPIYKLYKVTNLVNNKVYIGQTVQDLKSRWADHCSAKPNKHRSALRSAIIKHSKQSFVMELIAITFTPEESNTLEFELIKSFDSLAPKGYNLKCGGGSFGSCHADTKAKISKIQQEKRKPIVNATTGEVFQTSREVEQKTGLSRRNILKCCKNTGSYKTVGGFVFRYVADWDGQLLKPEDMTSQYPTKYSYTVKVFKKDILVGEWDSMSACAKTLGFVGKAHKNCGLGTTIYKGYKIIKEVSIA